MVCMCDGGGDLESGTFQPQMFANFLHNSHSDLLNRCAFSTDHIVQAMLNKHSFDDCKDPRAPRRASRKIEGSGSPTERLRGWNHMRQDVCGMSNWKTTVKCSRDSTDGTCLNALAKSLAVQWFVGSQLS